ncbi:MAG: hypothetical protein A2Y25_11800 [Candidatus Melainabacteria bacterium GWF2_37_15]|nr:MAG: hypothetical protein A2Y25_11800 [Candidatus Melainabacteria bacterium GWF2_37_15]
MNKKNIYTNFDEFLIKELKNPEIAKSYLEENIKEYLKDNNTEVFLHCLKPLVQAQGPVSHFAEKVGVNRTYLYKIFNNKVKPEFSLIIKIIDNLGFEFSFVPKKKRYAT